MKQRHKTTQNWPLPGVGEHCKNGERKTSLAAPKTLNASKVLRSEIGFKMTTLPCEAAEILFGHKLSSEIFVFIPKKTSEEPASS